jgi:hypothetical protein
MSLLEKYRHGVVFKCMVLIRVLQKSPINIHNINLCASVSGWTLTQTQFANNVPKEKQVHSESEESQNLCGTETEV